MPYGGKLTIETGNRSLDERAARERDIPPGQYVSLAVSDTGSGMTPEVIRRAFDPFHTTKPLGMGAGLGLSMVYGFARQSGGQVRIYSEVGKGTIVRRYLPRDSNETRDHSADSQTGKATVAVRNETILGVDDEPTVRMLVVEVLQDLGCIAMEAPDGAAGLKILNSEAQIALPVTDVGLPGRMNGRQLADAARTGRPDLFVGSEILQRAVIELNGVVVSSETSCRQPANNRCVTEYVVASVEGSRRRYIAGPVDHARLRLRLRRGGASHPPLECHHPGSRRP